MWVQQMLRLETRLMRAVRVTQVCYKQKLIKMIIYTPSTPSNYKACTLCPSVCCSHISRAVLLIGFTLGMCLVEGPRKIWIVQHQKTLNKQMKRPLLSVQQRYATIHYNLTIMYGLQPKSFSLRNARLYSIMTVVMSDWEGTVSSVKLFEWTFFSPVFPFYMNYMCLTCSVTVLLSE